MLAEDDCDDDNPYTADLSTDADCDGVWSHNDCDDDDPSIGARFRDTDCDGTYDERFEVVSAGSYHSCGIDSSGSVYCWGIDSGDEWGGGFVMNRDYGQLMIHPVVVLFKFHLGGTTTVESIAMAVFIVGDMMEMVK